MQHRWIGHGKVELLNVVVVIITSFLFGFTIYELERVGAPPSQIKFFCNTQHA